MRRLIFTILIIGLLLSMSISAFAEFPDREIEWIIWSSPGGGSDLTARSIGMPLRPLLGVPLIITNMPGGSGARAINAVMEREADGHTWLFFTATAIAATHRGIVDYEMSDFVPVFRLNYDPQTIVVPAASAIETLEDLVELGKERPLKWGLTHLGSIDHIGINAFAEAAGVEYDPVVFQSGAEVTAGALGGVIDVFISNPSEVMGQIEAGTMKFLAVMSEERLDLLGDIPTCVEKGYDVSTGTWRGIVVKKGTDPEIVKTLEKLFFEAADTDTYRSFLKRNAMSYAVQGSEEFGEFIKRQTQVYLEQFEKLGLEAD